MSFLKKSNFIVFGGSSRKLFGVGLLIMTMTSLSGCNLFKSSPKDRDDSVRMKETGDCTVDVRQSFKDFVAGTATQTQVKTSLECISHDLEQFKLRTKSSTSGDQYTLQEVSSFFAKYFGGAQEFSLPSLTAYLKFKNFVLGGGELVISKAEITVIQNLIIDANPVLAGMAQDINIYKLQTPLNLGDANDTIKMAHAIDGIHKICRVIKNYLPGKSGALFKFTDLDTLDFAKSDIGANVSETEAVQLIMNLKSILVNPPDDRIKGEDFKHFVTQLDLILETALRIKYTRDLSQDRDDVFVQNIVSLKASTAQMFQNSFSYQKNSSIPYVELVKFLKKLDKYSLIPFGLKEKSVEDFLPILLTKVLAKTPYAKTSHLANLSFTDEHLATVLDAVDEWASLQMLFLSALSNRDEIRARELIEKFDQGARGAKNAKIEAAYRQMKEILSTGVFLRWKDKDKLNFAPRDIQQNFSRYDLLFLSSSFSIIRQIMRSQIMDSARRQNVSSMNEEELTQLYIDVREMGKDLKFIDVRNRLAPSRAFLENNIFMSVSNGNDLVEFHEAIEWFYQVWSAGNMGLRIYDQVPEKCKTQELDVFEHRKLDHACYSTFFKAHVREFFDNLPELSVYFNQLMSSTPPPTNAKKPPADPLKDFEVNLENAFRSAGYSTSNFDSPDTEAMSLILSYTESVFINHSHAHNGELDTQDVWDIYPLMRGFIERASNGAAKNEFIKKAAYSYLITFGEMPSADGFANLVKFGSWTVLREFHKETAYVGDIIKVISTFSLAGKNSKIKAAEAYFTAHKDTIEADVRAKNPKTMADLKDLLFCTDDVASYLDTTLVKDADEIFTKNPAYDATSFHKTIEKIIIGDPKLNLECLDFE